MPDSTEWLSTYIARIERAEQQYGSRFEERGIIISTEIETETLMQGEVSRVPILWRLYKSPMVYLTTVPAGAKVPEHSHDEDVFRLLTNGSLTVRVNNQDFDIKAGVWFAIRAGTSYSIETPEGYTCLSTYEFVCQPANQDLG